SLLVLLSYVKSPFSFAMIHIILGIKKNRGLAKPNKASLIEKIVKLGASGAIPNMTTMDARMGAKYSNCLILQTPPIKTTIKYKYTEKRINEAMSQNGKKKVSIFVRKPNLINRINS